MMVHRYACEAEDCDTYVDLLAREGVPHCECCQEMEFDGTLGCVTGVSADQIELTDRQRERIDRIKDELEEAEPDCPRPTDEQVLKSLLDTWDAVDDGLYAVPQEGESDVR